MISVLILALYNYAVALDLDVLRIRNDRNVKMLGDLRANLCSITIDCLTAGNDQIILQISDRARKCGGGCPCVSAAEHSVGHEHALVRAHSHRLAQNLFRLGKAHRYNRYLCAVLIL